MKKILLWAVLVIFGLFVVLVIARLPHAYNKQKTDEQVAKIHAIKLRLDDVMGKNLPSDPGIDADKTIQGIDTNHNGIRDDVELAIFKEYPNSAKTRAVLLQYALALQMEMTQPIVNTETVTAVAEDGDRARNCIRENTPRDNMDLQNFVKILKSERDFVNKLQINTEQRDKYQHDFYEHLGSHSSPNTSCDLDISALPN